MIEFNRSPMLGTEIEYVRQAIANGKLCGDGPFTKKSTELLKAISGSKQALLTTSCTHALEMAAFLADICPGDEVIMPSYTFVSTADAFVLRGAKIVFVDIEQKTMNIDANKIEQAITDKTKAIVPVHYAGVACDMDAIMALAKKYNLIVIEDAAQAVNAFYKDTMLGTIGDYGCYSFHETKNYTMGEGGALLFQDDTRLEAAEILREKGTNRSKFFRGQVDKYTWVGYGSSYLPSDMNAAYLYAQLLEAGKINDKRHAIYNIYDEGLKDLADAGYIEQPFVPEYAKHNAHMYYIKVKDMATRNRLIEHLKQNDVMAVFHYIPLHSSPAGKEFGRFAGIDEYTTKESERLLRLPMFYNMELEDVTRVVEAVRNFKDFNCRGRGRTLPPRSIYI